MSPVIHFNVKLALKQPGWRQQAAWPLTLTDTHSHNRAAWKAFWPLLHDRSPDERDIMLLAGGRIVWQCLALGEAASVVQAAAEKGLTIADAPPAVEYLMHSVAGDLPPAELAPNPFKAIKATRFSMFRRIARSTVLSAPRAWPRLIATSDAVALSYNSMMHAFAHRHGKAVRFMHADDLLLEAGKFADSQMKTPEWIKDVAGDLAEGSLGGRDLDPRYRQGFLRLARPFIESQLTQTARYSAALKLLPDLPMNIWCGGQLSARYVATEARRRGAIVTGFEHGWGLACEDAADLTAYAELATVDRYVAMTQVSSQRLKSSTAHKIASPEQRIQFIAGPGDIEAKRLLQRQKPRSGASKPTVVYAPTVIAGFRQFLPPLLPDTIHLDWQFRVCEQLMKLPINFICRPHPEGIFRNQRHPLHALLQPSDRRFEELMAETDVFVFDFQQSTTFGRALCSNRPIVLIDFGTPAFDAQTEKELKKRCRVVKAQYDERNRPFVDPIELKDAICGHLEQPVDSTYFRALMLGC